GNGCVVTSSPAITVEAPPQLALPDTVPLCLTDADVDLQVAITITADSTGGTFSWAGPGVIDPDGTFNASVGNLAEGAYTLTVSYQRNECAVSDSLVVVLAEAEPLAIDPVEPVCISQDTLQLNVNLPGGSWSGPGNPTSQGVVDLQAAGGGMHAYTYLYAAGTSCEQEASITVEVIDLGSVVSAGNPEAVCEGPAGYTLSGGSPAGGQWSGPGIMDSDAGSINLALLTPGQTYQYDYCIESGEVQGCSACATKTLTYNPKPEAGFSFEGTPCINTTFTLIPDQPGLNYEWNFGDGNGSTAENPTHEYTLSGTYTLTQAIRTNAGCADTTSQELYITSPPTADFELLSDEGCAPFELALENNSFGDDITQQWCINGDTIGGAAPPVYVFDSLVDDTFFPIILKVTNLCGTRMDSASVLVHPYPLADFGISEDEGCSPFLPDVSNITLGNPDNFRWSLNGVPFSTDSIPVLPGLTTPDDSVSVYTLQLIADNACGSDTLSKAITVYPPDVEAFIELDTLRGCQPFTMFPESFSTPGSVLSWEVYGPQGQYAGGTGTRPELLLPDPGLYTIVLFASRCGTDSDTAQVEVLPAPEVGFEHEPSVCLGDTIRFRNTSIEVGGSAWDFGDGNTSAAFSPIHTYDTAGVFTVTYTGLSLINNCPATDSSMVTIYGLPQSAFSPGITAGCPPLEVSFANQSTGVGNLNYRWFFGDGTNSTSEPSPTHTFTESGIYRVKLVAYDDAGCFSDTATALITVHPEPVSAFELSQESLCIGYDTLRV
ncbi:MAG: PKD domain-containing protein, partial [Phaeodactylibacter sp.]|nr:PKD domain-containing protein [Phaeodactylibacter sp.]